MAGVAPRSACITAAVILLLHTVTSAPVTEEGHSQSLQLGDLNGDGRGCYYNFEHYDEGDRILTNEPCLNCTCHNKMLMCYLRVCPFTKAIGQDCTIEKKPDQCCPVITCPQVPVALLTSSTTSETPPTTTALGRPDNYGCILEDSTFYPDGAQVPSDPRKPCELCYCIRNHTACVMQECTLNVEGCRPVYQEGVCCPVRYDCDYDDVQTTPKPLGLVTTPGGSSDCLHNGVVYHDGAMVMKDEKAPCEHCYCMRGDIVCAVQECGTPLEGRDCTPMEPTPGQCCPNYHCANGTVSTESTALEVTSTEKLPEEVKEDSSEEEKEKPESEESSNETDKSSEESNEAEPAPQPSDNNGESVSETSPHQEESHTAAPEETNVSEDVSPTELNPPSADIVQQSEVSEDAAQTVKPDVSPSVVEQAGDSDSEASQHQESEAQVPQEVAKDPQATNEIPESTPYEQPSPTTTEEPPVEAARVPGEGSCLVEGKTYAHNTVVPTANPCQEVCRCFSSIVSCKPRACPPAPSVDENCMPVTTPGSCCPTYMCDQKTSDAPEVQDHKIDIIPHDEGPTLHEDSPTTFHPEEDTHQATESPIQPEIPSDDHIPETHEDGHTGESPSEELAVTHVENAPITEQSQVVDNQISSDENGHVNSQIVHGLDAAVHGGESEHLDSQENGKQPHPISDFSTVGPANVDNISEDQTSEEGFNRVTTYSTDESGSHTETIQTSGQETEILKPDDGQDEGSGQEYSEATPVTEENNELQGQSIVEPSQPSSDTAEESTTGENVVHEGVEHPLPEENVHTIVEDTSATSEEAKPEEVVTEAPAVAESSSPGHHDSVEETVQTEQYHSESPPAENQPTNVHSDGIESTNTQINIEEVTTTSAGLSEISHDVVSAIDEEVHSQKEEDVPTETPQESPSESEAQEQDSAQELQQTTVASVDGHLDGSAQETVEQDLNEPVNHGTEIVTDQPPVNHSELPEEPTTHPIPQEGEVTEGSVPSEAEEVHHDAVPDSSQQSIETSHDIPHADDQTHVAEGESVQHEETANTDSQNVNEATTLPPQTQEAEKNDQMSHDVEHSETISENPDENKENETDKNHSEITSESSSHEVKPEETSSSSSSPEEVTTPAPSNQAASSDSLPDHPHVDYSTVIYEEVKVTGMPPIESHVTEGTSDLHPPSPSTPAPEAYPVTEGIHIPGPEGIKVEEEGEKDSPPDTQESHNTVQSEVPLEPITVLSDEKPEVDQPETKPEEGIAPSHETDESTSPQDANEAGSALSETVHPGTSSSQEIINEINEEKESLNQITSDNTAQTIDEINQSIQNEIHNELYPGEVSEPTATEQPHHPPLDAVSESSPAVVSEISHSEESDQGTTAPPLSVPEEPSSSEGSPSEPAAVPQDGEKSEQPANENIVSEPAEGKPSESISEDTQKESDATTVFTTPEEVSAHTESPTSGHEEPTASNVSSDTTLHESSQVEQHLDENKEEKPQEEVVESDVPAEAMPGESSDNDSEHASSATEFHENLPITDKPEEAPSQVSENENQVILNELPGEKPQEESPKPANEPAEEEGAPEDTLAVHTEVPQTPNESEAQEENKLPSVSEDHNAIVDDVTHIESNVPQVPDSANQLLETSEKTEEVPTTVQPAQGTVDLSSSDDGAQSTHIASEEGPSSHETAVPQEETVTNDENKNEHLMEPAHGDEVEHHQENTSASEETPSEHEETPQEMSSEHEAVPTEPGTSVDHQETTSEHQELPTDQETFTGNQEMSTDQEKPNEDHETATEQQETSTQRQEISSEPQETPAEHQESAIEHQETPAEHQESSIEHQETPAEHQESPIEHQETPPEHQESPIEHQETPTEHIEHPDASTEHQETITEHEETPSVHEEVPPEHEETSSVHEEVPTEHEETLSVHEEVPTELQETPAEHQETTDEHQETTDEHQETTDQHPEIPTDPQETPTKPQETSTEHQETSSEHQETDSEHQETASEPQETVTERHEEVHHESSSDHQTTGSEEQGVVPEHHPTESHEIVSEHQETVTEQQETISEHQDVVSGQEVNVEHQESITEQHENVSEHSESIAEQQETVSEHHDLVTESPAAEIVHTEISTEHQEKPSLQQETVSEQEETASEHHDTVSENETHVPITESSEKENEVSTSSPHIEVSSEAATLEHLSTEGIQHSSNEPQIVHGEEESHKQEVPTTIAPETGVSNQSIDAQKPDQISEQIQSIIHSTETASILDLPSSTQKPIVEEPNPMFPSWSQKPFEHHTTPEPHTPEENPYPTGFDPEYEDEEGVSYGPGTCRYGGKVYLSAQQIPRDDPCDFCFCFRSDIICLQQSCPPPIRGCYQETIKGFCCPRYECHVSMATMLNITTTTTTTTTTLPPHFFAHAYNGAATKAGCQVKGVAYHVGERIPSTSGPCLECRCGANGQMKCDPTVCGPQEALLRQVMDAAVSKRRR